MSENGQRSCRKNMTFAFEADLHFSKHFCNSILAIKIFSIIQCKEKDFEASILQLDNIIFCQHS